MRSLAVGQHLARRLEEVVFAVDAPDQDLTRRVLAEHGFSPWTKAGDETWSDLLTESDLICLDRKEPEKLLAQLEPLDRVTIISDRPFKSNCRLFVWPELQAGAQRLTDLGYSDDRIAAGPDYVLVRDQIRQLDRRPAGRGQTLVLLGGGDPGQGLADLVRRLDPLELDFDLCLALADNYPVCSELEQMTKSANHYLEMAILSPKLNDWLATADLAIHGAGTIAYEMFCLGLPGVAVVTAPDQVAEAEWMAAQDLGPVAELSRVEEIVSQTERFLLDPDLGREIGQRRRLAVDGLGPIRVAERMLKQLE
ncbi:MAG: hypothetical protein JRJ59_04265 [Deltaproteobacteria bacterium]|nr:hypothetical protein [Deltaproteobacteria bacterium]